MNEWGGLAVQYMYHLRLGAFSTIRAGMVLCFSIHSFILRRGGICTCIEVSFFSYNLL